MATNERINEWKNDVEWKNEGKERNVIEFWVNGQK